MSGYEEMNRQILGDRLDSAARGFRRCSVWFGQGLYHQSGCHSRAILSAVCDDLYHAWIEDVFYCLDGYADFMMELGDLLKQAHPSLVKWFCGFCERIGKEIGIAQNGFDALTADDALRVFATICDWLSFRFRIGGIA